MNLCITYSNTRYPHPPTHPSHLTASRRAGKRVRGGDDLPLNPQPPPHPPTQTGLPARHLRSTHRRRVYVWGGEDNLVTPGGGERGGACQIFDAPLIAVCVCVCVNWLILLMTHIRVNVIHVNVPFGFMSQSA